MEGRTASCESPAGALRAVVHAAALQHRRQHVRPYPLMRALSYQVFIEIFSGCGRLAKAVSCYHGPVLLWDISMGAQYDLTRQNNQSLLRGWIAGKKVWGYHVAVPCSPLPDALDLAPAVQAVQVQERNLLTRFSFGLLRLGRRHGCPCSLENPLTGTLFKTSGFDELSKLAGFSWAIVKRTRFVGFNLVLRALSPDLCRAEVVARLAKAFYNSVSARVARSVQLSFRAG